MLENQYPAYFAWLIWTTNTTEAFSVPSVEFYKSRGLISEFSDINDIVTYTNIPKDCLENLFNELNDLGRGLKQDVLGRPRFDGWLRDMSGERSLRYYVAAIVPAVHYTMGGVMIDDHARMISRAGDGTLEPIPGVFAAGEVTGGILVLFL
jgi:FAD-dependent fumarate reductase